MKKFIVFYRPRGANYNFMTPMQIVVLAKTAKEAREECIMRVGDIYKVVKTKVL